MDTTTEQAQGGYIGKQGDWLWRGEDIDEARTITWDGIDITGKTDLQFSGLFGANSVAVYEDPDSLLVEYDIGGGFQTLIDFRSSVAGPANGVLALTPTGNGIGDGTGLTNTLVSSGPISIPGTGTNLKLRLTFSITGNNEEFAVDQFTLTSEVVSAPEMRCIRPWEFDCRWRCDTFPSRRQRFWFRSTDRLV